uniref:Uncharacterized protein n=1 Tax=Arundo donax TaxID=35708 RepID=A0A0A9ECX8_ARUDO
MAQNILKVMGLQMMPPKIHLSHYSFHTLKGAVQVNLSTIFSTVMSIIFLRPWMLHVVLISQKLQVDRLRRGLMIIFQSCPQLLFI